MQPSTKLRRHRTTFPLCTDTPQRSLLPHPPLLVPYHRPRCRDGLGIIITHMFIIGTGYHRKEGREVGTAASMYALEVAAELRASTQNDIPSAYR